VSTAFFYGNLSGAGHFLYRAGSSDKLRDPSVECYGGGKHIDGTLAPRIAPPPGSGRTSVGAEAAQGVYTVVELDNGYTALAWWDRTHGDTRPGCNSIVLLPGKRTERELFDALLEHWPRVLEDMAKAGILFVRFEP